MPHVVQRWQIMQDTQTKIFEITQDVTVNKARTADKAFAAMDGYIGGMGGEVVLSDAQYEAWQFDIADGQDRMANGMTQWQLDQVPAAGATPFPTAPAAPGASALTSLPSIANAMGPGTIFSAPPGAAGTADAVLPASPVFGAASFSDAAAAPAFSVFNIYSSMKNTLGTARTLDGTNGADKLTGSVANETMRGLNGNDQLFGNLGDDAIDGGRGNDWLFGGFGNDALTGGAGNDKISGGDGADTVNGGDGVDDLFGRGGDDRMAGGAGNDTILGDNSSPYNLPQPGGVPAGGADTLFGDAGNDILCGFAGNDALDGGDGVDKLYAGEGVDRLAGGLGADQFFFNSALEIGGGETGVASDVVLDFAKGEKINLVGVDAKALTRFDDAFTFIGKTAFSGVEGQLRFANIPDQNITVVEGDLDADRIADFQLQVMGQHTFVAGDFVL